MSSRFRHALVIGKFYPPHSGHEYLIRTAADTSQFATVVVMAADVEGIPLALRVKWLQEIFSERANVTVTGVVDNDPVDYHSESIWALHVEHMRRGIAQADSIRNADAGRVDAIFSSENYGAELARRFDAVGVCLDQARELYPVSGTAVRADPASCWMHLSPCVREYLCQRLVIVGAESSGKSTLTTALMTKLRERGGAWARTEAVAEYGREFTANKIAIDRGISSSAGIAATPMENLSWQAAEFELIAREQQQREDAAARLSGPVLVCDTDAFATSIWFERYLGHSSLVLDAAARTLPLRLGYILTSWSEVPFEQDGLRDGERIRGWMHECFIERLNEAGYPWQLVSGPLHQRVDACIDWMDTQLRSAWSFPAPLG